MSRTPILVSHSGGKDSILLIDQLLREDRWDIVSLVTMVSREDQWVSMHGVPRRLLERQAEALGFPLTVVEVPRFPSNEVYESALNQALVTYKAEGVTTMAFGDLFLADIRQYREELCQRLGITPIFPLWELPTRPLAEAFITRGYRAVVCCVDARCLMADFAGRDYDAGFLQSLPDGVDWCGENGEFHTFVWDGPVFHAPVPICTEATSQRGDFWYAELNERVDSPDRFRPDVEQKSKSVEWVDV
ncbi:ATP-binding protein [bacterium]|nr:ATP-binding protein [bacterium]